MVLIRKYKIRRTGSRGQSITIPKTWMETENVGFGDEVAVFQDKGTLILKAIKNSKEESK